MSACVLQTAEKYTGDLMHQNHPGADGVAGADAKCAAEFPGFKFARSHSVMLNVANGSFAAIDGPWVPWSGTFSTNCLNWTSADHNQNGGKAVFVPVAGGSAYGTQYEYCDAEKPLLCCNM